MTSIFQPITWFTDKAGNPLDNGEIYLGTSGLDARTNPIAAYRDSALTIPWVQPIPTVSGYPAYQGAPARIYISPSSCSMTVLQNDGQVVFNNIEAAGLLDAFGTGGAAIAGGTTLGLLARAYESTPVRKAIMAFQNAKPIDQNAAAQRVVSAMRTALGQTGPNLSGNPEPTQ